MSYFDNIGGAPDGTYNCESIQNRLTILTKQIARINEEINKLSALDCNENVNTCDPKTTLPEMEKQLRADLNLYGNEPEQTGGRRKRRKRRTRRTRRRRKRSYKK